MNNSSFWWIVFILTALALFSYIGFILIIRIRRRTTRILFHEGDERFPNPYKGWVAWANRPISISQHCSLAYAPLYWKDFEEKKGLYEFNRFERDNNFSHWADRGVKIIIRFICDYPIKGQAHMDIPRWLYEEMQGDGNEYNMFYGMGFCPNYSNPVFMENHRRVIKAIADRYNNSNQIAFIQLGSLGHFGEWHIREDGDLPSFPAMDVANSYIRDYVDYFDSSKLLMRRPYPMAKEHNLGLYNDILGDEEATRHWLSWINDGSVYDPTGEKMPDMPGFWQTAPAGGELTSETTLDNFFGSFMYARLKTMLTDCHVSFIGPNSPVYMRVRGMVDDNVKDCNQLVGYRFSLKYAEYCMTVKKNSALSIDVKLTNTGIAPFYFDWKLTCFFTDSDDETVLKIKSTGSIKGIMGEFFDNLVIPISLEKGVYTLKLGLVNPCDEDDRICFANLGGEDDRLHKVGNVIVI